MGSPQLTSPCFPSMEMIETQLYETVNSWYNELGGGEQGIGQGNCGGRVEIV